MPTTASLTINDVRNAHQKRREEIVRRLDEFQDVWQSKEDTRIWEELVFCIFTANASARIGLRSVAAFKDLLQNGTTETLAKALTLVNRFPNARGG